MSRYDGLIIPRSYSDYINKTDAATLLQALQLSGVMDNAPTANSNHPTKSGGIYDALATKQDTLTFDDTPTQNSNNPVKSGGVYTALSKKQDNVFIVKETKSIASANWAAVCQIANVPAGDYKAELSMNTKCQTNIQNTTTGEGGIPFLNYDTANRVTYITIPQTSNIQIAAYLAANTSYTFVFQLTKKM